MDCYRCLMFTLLMLVNIAQADGGDGSTQGSTTLSGEGASMIVAGSVEVLAETSALTIQGVETSAEGGVLILSGVAAGSELALRIATELAAELAGAVGSTVEVVTESAGYALIHAGKMIAYVPNELAGSLIHRSEHRQ